MAMGVFVIAAVALANAINQISLSVAESAEDVAVREQLRGVLLEASRSSTLAEGSRTIDNGQGIVFQIDIEKLNLKNREAQTLDEIYEVTATARRELAGQRAEIVESADTWVFKDMFDNR
jgi:hypothetical protein